MAKFTLDNYEPVEDRLKKFWKDFPKGRIDSNVVHITDDGTCVTIRTEIFKDINDDKPVTTGIAQETKGQGGFANADAWLENCETSAVGRALAFCGITNDSIASAEEVAAAIEQQDQKLQSALKSLEGISHAGNFQKWISDNKTFLADLKAKNPVSYGAFLEKFTSIKNQLKSKGVLQ